MTRKDESVAESRAQGTPESKPKAQAEQTWPRKIRTTHRPWKEIEVGESEYRDLESRGLIHKGDK